MCHGLELTGLSGIRWKMEREQGVNASSSSNWHKDAMNCLCDNTARKISGGLWARHARSWIECGVRFYCFLFKWQEAPNSVTSALSCIDLVTEALKSQCHSIHSIHACVSPVYSVYKTTCD